MPLSLTDIENQISQQSISSVTISGDNTMKGEQQIFSTSSLYISKIGLAYGQFDGSTITLQGGNPDWNGALIQDEYSLGYTRAQYTLLNQIIGLLKSANSNAFIITTGVQ